MTTSESSGAGGGSTMVELTVPGVFAASPGSTVPPGKGSPAPSKSFRAQSETLSVSTPLGNRDAPPGMKPTPSNPPARTVALPYQRSLASPSSIPTASRTAVQGSTSNVPSSFVSTS